VNETLELVMRVCYALGINTCVGYACLLNSVPDQDGHFLYEVNLKVKPTGRLNVQSPPT
jgi:hypothetical protein